MQNRRQSDVQPAQCAVDTKSMAARLAQLRVEMERERAEREHNRTAAYLWSSSVSPGPKKNSGSKIESGFGHYATSKHSWRPPELHQKLSRNLTKSPDRWNEASTSQRRTTDVLAPQNTSSLLDGTYDEERAAMDFQEALRAWRGHANDDARPVTTSTAVCTGGTHTEPQGKKQQSYTMFQRFVMGHMSQEASFQAAQDCVCQYTDRGKAGDSPIVTADVQTEPACTTEPGTAEPSDPEVSDAGPSQLELSQGGSHINVGAEDVSEGNVLSISNMQSSQALTSRIRLPDAVHVPVLAP